jgi:hypothetical protein
VTAPGAGAPPPPTAGDSATNVSRPTTRADRIRDAVALALVLGGVALVLVSHAGMQKLATQPIVVAKGQTAVAIWDKFAYIELAGYAAAVIGLLVGFVSYIIHARRGKPSPGAPPTA